MNTFAKLAQANLDHYNDHRVAHIALMVGYGAVATVAVVQMAKALSKPKSNPYVVTK